MSTLDEELDDYVRDYDDKIEEELRARKAYRKEKLKHARNITRCNILLVMEGITFVILVIAYFTNRF